MQHVRIADTSRRSEVEGLIDGYEFTIYSRFDSVYTRVTGTELEDVLAEVGKNIGELAVECFEHNETMQVDWLD